MLLRGTLKPRSASENCYISIQAYLDEMHNHDTKDHIGEQSLSHRIVARSVCAFGLGGERANTRTVQEENNTCYWLTKFQYEMSVITHSRILQSPASPKTSPFKQEPESVYKENTLFSLAFRIVRLLRHPTATSTDRHSRREIKDFPARRKDSTRGRSVMLSVSVRRPRRCYS